MKKKDLMYLVLAVGILLVAGYLAYTQVFAAKTGAKQEGTTVEVVGTIPSSVDSTVVSQLGDSAKVRDFTPAIDLNGLGNTAPFGNGQ